MSLLSKLFFIILYLYFISFSYMHMHIHTQIQYIYKYIYMHTQTYKILHIIFCPHLHIPMLLNTQSLFCAAIMTPAHMQHVSWKGGGEEGWKMMASFFLCLSLSLSLPLFPLIPFFSFDFTPIFHLSCSLCHSSPVRSIHTDTRRIMKVK